MATLNTEVVRLLGYMAAFTPADPAAAAKVAALMDKIANAPTVGSAVTANRSSTYEVPFATAQMALAAVTYAVDGGNPPEWVKQTGALSD